MRISIYDKGDGHRIRLYVPNALLSSRLIWRLAGKYGGNSLPLNAEQLRELTLSVRRYVRQNGHIDLVQVESADGDQVHIRL